jgi:hypothetical protein
MADLTRLREIDLASGDLLRSIAALGAVFLNDVASEVDAAYASDFLMGRIWRHTDGALEVWLEAGAIAHPNGLLVDGDRLLMGGWGEGLSGNFTTEIPGSLHAVSLADRIVSTLAEGLGNLDGLARAAGALFVSDGVAGSAMQLGPDGAVTLRRDLAPGVVDIAADGDRILLPMMRDGRLDARVIE